MTWAQIPTPPSSLPAGDLVKLLSSQCPLMSTVQQPVSSQGEQNPRPTAYSAQRGHNRLLSQSSRWSPPPRGTHTALPDCTGDTVHMQRGPCGGVLPRAEADTGVVLRHNMPCKVHTCLGLPSFSPTWTVQKRC